MSDPRPPEDGSSWPERDLDRNDEPASGWSDDDPYRYEPPPRWEPQPFEPPPDEQPAWRPPSFDDDDGDDFDTAVAEPAEVEEPTFGQPASAEEGVRDEPAPDEAGQPEEPAEPAGPERPYAGPFYHPISHAEPMPEPSRAESAEDYEVAEPEVEAEPEPMAAEPMGAEPMAAVEEAAETQAEAEPEADFQPEQVAEAEAQQEQEQEQEQEHEQEAEPGEEPGEAEAEPPVLPEPMDAAVETVEPPPLAPVREPVTEAAEPVTAFEGAAAAWDPKLHGNRRRTTTAEQAVPWLIGIILALAGMVIVLLALIFTSPGGLVAGQSATPTPTVVASVRPSPTGLVAGGPSDSAEPSATPPEASPTPSQPPPTYGALEMVYLGRQSGTAPVYLLNRDFSKRKQAEIMAQATQGVAKFSWAPDGTVGAAVISERAVALRPGKNPKELIDNVSALTFGWDADTLYVVRITRDGAQDKAHIVEVGFKTGDSKLVATVRYKHPATAPDAALREAQFIDNGGLVRIYAVADGRLNLWVLGAPDTYQIDPADGSVTKIDGPPELWSPDGTRHIGLKEVGNKTTIRLRNRDAGTIATTTVTGLVSHVRWAGGSNEIVFTLGVLSAAGGVRQDLYVWDLKDGNDPLPLTSTGAAFGAEWRGVMCNWLPSVPTA